MQWVSCLSSASHATIQGSGLHPEYTSLPPPSRNGISNDQTCYPKSGEHPQREERENYTSMKGNWWATSIQHLLHFSHWREGGKLILRAVTTGWVFRLPEKTELGIHWVFSLGLATCPHLLCIAPTSMGLHLRQLQAAPHIHSGQNKNT